MLEGFARGNASVRSGAHEPDGDEAGVLRGRDGDEGQSARWLGEKIRAYVLKMKTLQAIDISTMADRDYQYD